MRQRKVEGVISRPRSSSCWRRSVDDRARRSPRVVDEWTRVSGRSKQQASEERASAHGWRDLERIATCNGTTDDCAVPVASRQKPRSPVYLVGGFLFCVPSFLGRTAAGGPMRGFVMVQERPGFLDVLAVLEGAGQLCVESGVFCAATCSLGKGGAEKQRGERGPEAAAGGQLLPRSLLSRSLKEVPASYLSVQSCGQSRAVTSETAKRQKKKKNKRKTK